MKLTPQYIETTVAL